MDKEWLHADQDLKPAKQKLVRYKTHMMSMQKQTTFHDSIAKRTAFAQIERKPTLALPQKKNEFIDDRKTLPILDETQIRELFEARCSDQEIDSKDRQFKRF